jgi:ankyrin repeat protein
MSANLDLLEAVKAGDVERVKALLEPDPALVNARDDSGSSAVLLGVYYGRKNVVELLLSYKPYMNLFEASAAGDLKRIKALLEEDPDLERDRVNSFAHDGFTPLGLASFFGHGGVVEYLLSRGAEANLASRNRMQVMPLHSAVAGRHIGIARTLLEHGADVNAAQQDGFVPLHGAAQNGQADMIELLLEYGADVNAQNAEGLTALAIAVQEGHAGAAELLRQHGAM